MPKTILKLDDDRCTKETMHFLNQEEMRKELYPVFETGCCWEGMSPSECIQFCIDCAVEIPIEKLDCAIENKTRKKFEKLFLSLELKEDEWDEMYKVKCNRFYAAFDTSGGTFVKWVSLDDSDWEEYCWTGIDSCTTNSLYLDEKPEIILSESQAEWFDEDKHDLENPIEEN